MNDRAPHLMPSVLSFMDFKWEAYLYFVWEREAIRMARENGMDKPWTIDDIMAKYRFCNIRRRDDRMTKWLIDNIYSKRREQQDLWFVATICRLINWPPTIQLLDMWMVLPKEAEDFNSDKFISVIEDIIDAGNKAYGGAYMTYPGRETGSTKSEFFATKILKPLVEIADDVRSEMQTNTVEDTVNILSSSFGLSTFLAGQVAADLTYFDEQLGGATDLYEYAPIGPGSQVGLNYLHGKKLLDQWKQGDFNRALIQANNRIKDECGIMDLTLHDVQNTFCEFGKYCKALTGGGRPRTLYKPETAY